MYKDITADLQRRYENGKKGLKILFGCLV